MMGEALKIWASNLLGMLVSMHSGGRQGGVAHALGCAAGCICCCCSGLSGRLGRERQAHGWHAGALVAPQRLQPLSCTLHRQCPHLPSKSYCSSTAKPVIAAKLGHICCIHNMHKATGLSLCSSKHSMALHNGLGHPNAAGAAVDLVCEQGAAVLRAQALVRLHLAQHAVPLLQCAAHCGHGTTPGGRLRCPCGLLCPLARLRSAM